MSVDIAFLINNLNFLWHISNNSLVIKDDDETINVIDAFTRVTSVESKIDITHLSSFHSKEQSKVHDCLNPHIVIELIILFLDCRIIVNIDLSQDRVEQIVREGEYEAVAIVNLSSIIVATSSSLEREGQRDLAQNEEKDWEIVKIVLRVCQEAGPKGERVVDSDRRRLGGRSMSIDRRWSTMVAGCDQCRPRRPRLRECVYRSWTRHPSGVVFNSSQLSRYCFHCWSIRDTILTFVRLFLDRPLH